MIISGITLQHICNRMVTTSESLISAHYTRIEVTHDLIDAQVFVCRIGALIATVLFLFGASQNGSGRSSGGMYAGAAVLTVAATALGITAFIMLRRQPVDEPNKPAGEQPPPVGIATGQPHFQQVGVAGVYGSQAPNQQTPPPAQAGNGTTRAPSQQFSPQGHEHV